MEIAEIAAKANLTVQKKTISAVSGAGSSGAGKRKAGTRLGRAPIAAAEETPAHVRGEIEPESYALPGPAAEARWFEDNQDQLLKLFEKAAQEGSLRVGKNSVGITLSSAHGRLRQIAQRGDG